MRVSTSEILASVLGSSKDIKGAQKTSTPKSVDVLISKEAEVKDFSIKTLLDALFKDLSTNQKSKDTILQILQAKNISQNIKDTLSELKSIVDTLKNDKTLSKSAHALEKNFLDIKDINPKTMLTHIKNSGIFLESKLAQNPADIKEEILADTKANLLKIKEELNTLNLQSSHDALPKIDKALNSISYYQLISLSSNANISYLPLLWEGLDDAQVSIKKLKQKRYFCEINLKLKEFGEIDLLVMLFDDISINISIFTKSDKFLKKTRENLQVLRQGINSVGLLPQNIYLFDALKEGRAKEEMREYAKNQQVGQGVNFYV